MKKYEKPSLTIETLVPDTQIAAVDGMSLLGEEVIISGSNGWWGIE